MADAIIFKESGGPGVLQLENRDIGPPGPGELLLRQTAIGVNFFDLLLRSGAFPISLPSGIGGDSVGVVEALGAGVEGFSIGDRIVSVGPQPDAYATYRRASAAYSLKLPDAVSDELAVAAASKGLTAHYLITQAFKVRPGDPILFHAAAGGVGQIACQWLKLLGAMVIGTVGSEDKIAFALSHGCDVAINYRAGDLVERVLEVTGGKGVAAVYDSVGKDTFGQSLDCLRVRGTLVSFGAASGPIDPFDTSQLTAKGSLYLTRPSLAHYIATREDLETGAKALFELLGAGRIKVDITHRLPLADAAAAHALMEARATTGAIILIP